MAPNKKKKKPAGNPARGFATTSVASKPKQEKSTTTDEVTPQKKEDITLAEVAPKAPSVDEHPPEEVEKTPEELESQLEHDELQLLVEKHAAKARRESRRQVLKFQTDRRVLRSQSEPMTVHDWLSNDAMESIISLAQTESHDSNLRQGQQSLLKILSEEEALTKLWMLDLTLRDLGFTSSHIESVLRWLCANAAAIDGTAGIWGLQEALEWLALNHCESHSFSYVEPSMQRQLAGSIITASPGMYVLRVTSSDALTRVLYHDTGYVQIGKTVFFAIVFNRTFAKTPVRMNDQLY